MIIEERLPTPLLAHIVLYILPAPTLLRTIAIVPKTLIPFGLSLARVWIVTIQQKNMNTISMAQLRLLASIHFSYTN